MTPLRLWDPHAELEVSRRSRAAGALPPHEAAEALRTFFAMHGSTLSPPVVHRMRELVDVRGAATELADALCAAAEARRVTVTRRTRRRLVAYVEEAAEVLGPEVTPQDWIEIVLVDEDGQPVAEEPYRILLPDGRVRSGTTNLSGKAREEELDPGQCKVSFPRLDARTWEAA